MFLMFLACKPLKVPCVLRESKSRIIWYIFAYHKIIVKGLEAVLELEVEITWKISVGLALAFRHSI